MADTTLSSIVTNPNGRVSFSGLGSKIDFQKTVEAIVAAKRIPVDRLEAQIATNQDKIAAYQELRSHLATLQDSLKNLYGAVTVDRSKNIFEAKQAFASSGRSDGSPASSPANLIGVTVSNRAAVGKHTIEVIQTAASHRIGSGSFSSTSTNLGVARGQTEGSITGSFAIGGVSIDVLPTDTLQDLVDRVNNANKGAAATGVSASIVRVSETESYMTLTVDKAGKSFGTDADADIQLSDPEGVLGQLGVLNGADFANEFQAARKAQFYADGIVDPVTKQPLLIERDSNTVSDLFAGVTLSLYQAEPGTTITVDIDRNLTQAKDAIGGFVDAYNSVRSLLNLHLDTDPATGKPREDATLFGSTVLADVETRLGRILGNGAQGTSSAFTVLAQIGIDFVDNNSLADPLLANTLTLDNEKLDQALIGNIEDVKKMFTFDFSASSPQVTLLGFDGQTGHSASGYKLSVDWDEANGKIASATVDGVAAKVDGRRIIVEDGGAKGLILYFNGGADANDVKLDFSVGMGAQMFFEMDSLLNSKSGLVETEIKSLTTRNEQNQTRVGEMTLRLDLQREVLLAKYMAMETALSSMNNTIENLKQMTESMFGKN